MKDASTLTRLQRLDTLADLLSDGELHPVTDLAESLHVSPRTLARDLTLLRARGMAIDSAAGPGGGVQLSPQSRAPTLVLKESVAIELLLAVAVSEVLGLSLSGDLAGLRLQLARGFAPADRWQIGQLRQRIRVCGMISHAVLQTRLPEAEGIRTSVHFAFARLRKLTISYQDTLGRVTRRSIEPHALLLACPFWYVLAWDARRGAIRTFRMDRILDAAPQETHFSPRPLAPFWAHCENLGLGV